jgi:hypothetical protein
MMDHEPNAETLEAMAACERGEVTRYDSVEELFDDLFKRSMSMTITVSKVYNCGGEEYEVTQYNPSSFRCAAPGSDWADAVEFKHADDRNANRYVLSATDFEAQYFPVLEAGVTPPEAEQLPADKMKIPPPHASHY